MQWIWHINLVFTSPLSHRCLVPVLIMITAFLLWFLYCWNLRFWHHLCILHLPRLLGQIYWNLLSDPLCCFKASKMQWNWHINLVLNNTSALSHRCLVPALIVITAFLLWFFYCLNFGTYDFDITYTFLICQIYWNLVSDDSALFQSFKYTFSRYNGTGVYIWYLLLHCLSIIFT